METVGFGALDVVLTILLIGYLIYGFVQGFWVTLGGIIGLIAGGIAAYFAIPFVSSQVDSGTWRLPLVILTIFVLLGVGNFLGSAVGRVLRKGTSVVPLRFIGRFAGAIISVAVTALVLSLLGSSVNALGVPWLSHLITESKTLNFIDQATPSALKGWMAQTRGTFLSEGIPTILGQTIPRDQIKIPDEKLDTPDYRQASASVVRVTGLAFQCGQNQTGSGFVVAQDRVVTNAHVVAGVNEPVIDIPGQVSRSGRVVYFNPDKDIAVISVDRLGLQPIALAPEQKPGATGAFAGYPGGGPYSLQPAQVISHETMPLQNIYNAQPSLRSVYTVAGNIQPGNSGGPLLDREGRVAGVIFAKSTQPEPIGYALAQEILAPVARDAEGYTDQVTTGVCTRK